MANVLGKDRKHKIDAYNTLEFLGNYRNVFFKDADKNIYRIDLQTGIVGKCLINENNSLAGVTEYGTDSKKKNGYLYVSDLVLRDENGTYNVTLGVHTLIGLCLYKEEYKRCLDCDNTPVANHINNIGWDNRPCNLEISTQGWNWRHGKLVHSLHHHFKNEYTKEVTNGSKLNTVALKYPISVADIKAYESYLHSKGSSLDGYFPRETTEYTSIYRLNKFLVWFVDYKRAQMSA